MKIFKLEVTKDKIKCIDILPDVPTNKDMKYIYATESDIEMLDKSKIDFTDVSLDTSVFDL